MENKPFQNYAASEEEMKMLDHLSPESVNLAQRNRNWDNETPV